MMILQAYANFNTKCSSGQLTGFTTDLEQYWARVGNKAADGKTPHTVQAN